MGRSLARFTISEPLGVDWRDQLLCQKLSFVPALSCDGVVLRAGDGRLLACQMTDVARTAEGGVSEARVWFWCDVMANQSLAFTVEKAAPASGRLPVGPVQSGDLALDNGVVRVLLPGSRRFASPVCASEAPGPILGFGRSQAPWMGGSRWEVCLGCRSVRTEVLSSGPLWTEARVSYEFEHDATYAMTVRLYEGRDFLALDERLGLRREGRVWLDLYTGLEPNRFFDHTACASDSGEGQRLAQDIPYGDGRERIREVQMPAIGMYYVPHLAGHIGLLGPRSAERGLVAVVGLDGEMWEAAMHNRMLLFSGPGSRLELELNAREGRRRWALAVTDPEAALPARKGQYGSLVKMKVRLSETPLRDVLLMRSDAPERVGEPLLFTDEALQHARTRLIKLPVFRERLEAVQEGRLDDPAFGYLMTGRREYAEQTLQQVHSGLREKLDIVLNRGGITEGGAATISLSRPIRAWIGMLDLIRREPGLLDSPSGRDVRRLMFFFAHKMIGQGMWPHRRTALHQDHPESQKPLYSYPGDALPHVPYWINCLPNFQSDWLIALAEIGLNYPDHPGAMAWIDRCIEDLDAQFDQFVFETGAWIESMNYALYTLDYYAAFFVMLRALGLRDFFADERLLRWLDWHTRMLTPADPRIGGRQTQAYVGNAILPDGQSSVFNWYARFIPDRDLAGRLVETWQREGCSAFSHPAGTAIFNVLLDPDQQARPLRPTGSTIEPGFGALLRCAEGTDEETFLTFKAGPIFSHYEGDELSFHWHARGVPLCSEYGVYQGAAAAWAAHNLVEAPSMDGIRRGFLTDHALDESCDLLVGELPCLIRYMEDYPETFADPNAERFSHRYNYLDHEAPLGPKVYIRRALLFVKPHYLVLLDTVDGLTPSRFNLHCVADEVEVGEHVVHFRGRFGMDLTAFLADPPDCSVETGVCAPQRGEVDHSQRFVRVISRDRNVYRAVLYPHRPDEQVTVTRPASGIGLEVSGPLGCDRVWLARERTACAGDDWTFVGRTGFVRRTDGLLSLHLIRGERIGAGGLTVEGYGPVHVEQKGEDKLLVRTDGPARRVVITDAAGKIGFKRSSDGVNVAREGRELVLDVRPGRQSALLKRL